MSIGSIVLIVREWLTGKPKPEKVWKDTRERQLECGGFFFGIIDGLKERTKNEKVWRRYERKATGVWLKEQTRNSVYTQGEL